MALYATPQFNIVDTIAVGSSLNPPATGFTLTTGAFGTVTGTAILVVDYGNSNAVYISCTIAGAAVSSVTYLGGNVSANHAAGAAVTMGFTPVQYNSLVDFSGTNANLPWTSWTPTFTGGGSMTYTSVVLQYAKYCQIGKTVLFSMQSIGTTGGTPAVNINFTLPVAAFQNGSFGGGGAYVRDTSDITGAWQPVSNVLVSVIKYDGSNWGLGANRYITVSGVYQSA